MNAQQTKPKIFDLQEAKEELLKQLKELPDLKNKFGHLIGSNPWYNYYADIHELTAIIYEINMHYPHQNDKHLTVIL